MKELIEYIARALVDNPDDVEVSEIDHGRGVMTYQLHVNQEDMGRVIGKQGRVARAIRSAVKVAATRQNRKVTLEIR